MNVLIDTNILLDFIQHRENFSDSEIIIKLCASGDINGFMAAHSVPNMFYILRKNFTDEERREILLSLVELIPVASIDQTKIIAALNQKTFFDFEDCLQAECAKVAKADYIITRNVKDYEESKVKAVTAADFLKLNNFKD